MVYTYQEFQEEVCSWWDLRDFCWEYHLGTYFNDIDLDRVVDDDYVEDQVRSMAGDYQWDDIMRYIYHLENSSWGEGVYYDDGNGLRELDDDDFEATKDEVLNWFRENGALPLPVHSF